MREKYTLEQAAKLKGIPVDQMRRRILLKLQPGEATGDEREFLINAEDLGLPKPPPKSRILWIFPLILVTLQIFGLFLTTTYSKTYYCSDCGRERATKELFNRVVILSEVSDTGVSRLIGPAECGHTWVLREGRDWGGSTTRGPGYTRWNALWVEQHRLSSSDAAAIRWLLRNDVPASTEDVLGYARSQ